MKLKTENFKTTTDLGNDGNLPVMRCPDLKRGYQLSQRVSAAFWDALDARSENDLEDLLAWAKEMSNTNCGWQEFALKQAIINSVAAILTERKRGCA
jgi:hypothetical protein